mmetsp:Transcript_50308/g.164398  ORF Transcript_50308/g.164398 Transcript_50308/m.164398 type:complete len:353 (+) Transcript_50308:1044-2102(+)
MASGDARLCLPLRHSRHLQRRARHRLLLRARAKDRRPRRRHPLPQQARRLPAPPRVRRRLPALLARQRDRRLHQPRASDARHLAPLLRHGARRRNAAGRVAATCPRGRAGLGLSLGLGGREQARRRSELDGDAPAGGRAGGAAALLVHSDALRERGSPPRRRTGRSEGALRPHLESAVGRRLLPRRGRRRAAPQLPGAAAGRRCRRSRRHGAGDRGVACGVARGCAAAVGAQRGTRVGVRCRLPRLRPRPRRRELAVARAGSRRLLCEAAGGSRHPRDHCAAGGRPPVPAAGGRAAAAARRRVAAPEAELPQVREQFGRGPEPQSGHAARRAVLHSGGRGQCWRRGGARAGS